MDIQLFKGNLELILLSVLERGEKYGLEMTKEISLLSQNQIGIGAGSLYPALHRLEQQGFVRSQERTPPRGGSPVRFYTLTEEGGKALDDKRRTFASFNVVMKPFVEGGV